MRAATCLVAITTLVLFPVALANAQQPPEDVNIEQIVSRLSPIPPDIRLPTETELRKIGYSANGLRDLRGHYFRISAHETLLEVLLQTFGPNHPLTGRIHLSKANQHTSIQEYNAAELELEKAAAIFAARLPKNAPERFFARIGRIGILNLKGRHLDQLQAVNELIDDIKLLRPDDTELATNALDLRSVTLFRLGRFPETVRVGQQVLDRQIATHGANSSQALAAIAGQVTSLLANGQLQEAESLLGSHIENNMLDPDADRYVIASLLRARARISEAKLDFDGAREDFQRVYDIASGKKYRLAGITSGMNPDYETFSATRTALDMQRLTERKHRNTFFNLPGWEGHWAKIREGDEERLSTDTLVLGEAFEVQDRIQAIVAQNKALKAERSGWQYEKSEPFWRSVVEFQQVATGRDSAATAQARLDLAENLLRQRKPFAAQQEADNASQNIAATLPQQHPLAVKASTISAIALSRQGRNEQAAIAMDAALEATGPVQELVKPQFLELLIERDRILRSQGDAFDRIEFWDRWADQLEKTQVHGSFAQLGQLTRAILLWSRASTDTGECPPPEIAAEFRKTAAGVRLTPEDGSDAFIPPLLSETALLMDQAIAETIACGTDDYSKLFTFIDDLEKSRIHLGANESRVEGLMRQERWADLLMRHPDFGKDSALTDRVFQLVRGASAIAQDQIGLARSAGTDTDARQRRILASQGVGLGLRYALETQLRANWKFAETQAAAPDGTELAAGGWRPAQADAFEESFHAAQLLRIDENSQTLALASARASAPNPALRSVVARYQELSEDLFGLLSSTNPDKDRLAVLQAEHAKLDAQIQSEFPRYYEFAAPAPLGYWEVRSALEDGEGLLTILTVGEDVYVFAVSRSFRESRAWHRIEGGAEQVATLVTLLRCDIDPVECGLGTSVQTRGSGASELAEEWVGYEFDRNNAWSLYDLLIRPIAHVFEQQESYEDPTRKLFVVTSGAISALPLSVLLTEAPTDDGVDTMGRVFLDAPWLGDRFDMAYLPAVSDLQGTVRANRITSGFAGYGDPSLSPATEIQEPGKRGASMFQATRGGDPLADPSALKEMKSLPGAGQELAAIAALFVDAGRLVTQDAATEPAIKNDRQIAGSQVILFSTHGLLPDPRAGIAEAGLVMTPPASATQDNDGLLSASEAAALDFTSQLLVLSACNTASAGSLEGADSLSGLARSFIFAGAQNVYASHWRVSDEITKELMVLAIKIALENPSLNRSEALSRAMIAIRSGQMEDGTNVEGWTPDWSHPSAWAPFVTITSLDREVSAAAQ